jgi:1,4-alpha-glucan branching enzyme
MSVQADIEAIVHRDLAEPHRLLGAHPKKGGVVIRTYRPDAVEVVARPEGGKPVELKRVHDAGIFEGKIPGAEVPLRYELEVHYDGGQTYTVRDPYAFLPARAVTRSSTRSSARTCARSTACTASRSPSGLRRHAR